MRDVAPHFTCLGYRLSSKGTPLYYFTVAGEPRCYRASELASLAVLLDLVPDVDHWRALFPGGSARLGVDVPRAGSYFHALALRVGPYAILPESPTVEAVSAGRPSLS